jgi:hypothetical protein
MYFQAFRNRLWYHVHKAASEKTYYIQFQDQSNFPYANFPTSGTHSLITSRIDAGFRRVKKVTPSIFIEGTNLSTTRYLKVYYSLEGDTSWHAWGGSDGETNVVNTDGVTELSNPLGMEPSSLEYYYMQLRIDFVTGTATETPVLEAIGVRLLLRPNTVFGFSMTVTAAQDVEHGPYQDNRTPAQIIADLHEVRDSTTPVEFIDPYGTTYFVYMTAIQSAAVEEHAMERDTTNIEARVNINLVEAK